MSGELHDQYVERLEAYVRELEAWYVSDHQTTRETPEQCLADLRKRYGVSDLFDVVHQAARRQAEETR